MSVERNKEIGRRWFEEMWSRPDFDLAYQLIHPDFKPDYIGIPKQGPELVIHEIKYFRSAFHDLRYSVEDLIADKTKVWVRYTAKMRHGGSAWGFEPTNKETEVDGMAILEVDQEGKVIN